MDNIVRFCGRCGTKRSAGDRYCRECGAHYGADLRDPDESLPHRSGRVVLRLYSTFRWGDLPNIVDAKTSVAVDSQMVCPWTPYGFDATVTLLPGPHRVYITRPTTPLGFLASGFWKRPEITVSLTTPGIYEARLEPRGIPAYATYAWEIRQGVSPPV